MLRMAHPELWYFLAPAEEGEEMNFGKLEEVFPPLSHSNCVCSAGDRFPDSGTCAGWAYPSQAVRGEGKTAGATRLCAHGQDGATDGVWQPEVPLRANRLCLPHSRCCSP